MREASAASYESEDARTQIIESMPITNVLVTLRRNRALVGPVRLDGVAGCGTCVRFRAGNADAHRPIHQDLLDRGAPTPESWAPPLTAIHRSAIRVAATAIERAGDDRNDGSRPMLVLDLATLETSRARLVPDPLCPECGSVPDDNATHTASLRPQSVTVERAGDLRQRSLVESSDVLTTTYVNPDVGIVRALLRSDHSVFPTVAGLVGLMDSTQTEVGFGRTTTYDSAQVAAIAEALERWVGCRPGGRRTSVVAAAKDELACIDVERLGLHDDCRYDEPGFPFVRWSPDTRTRWVWGRDLIADAPLLVPEAIAYYRTHFDNERAPRLLYEISNGCAVGSSLTEAVLHGAVEVIERDAFLLTWYARRAVREIDLMTASSGRLAGLREHLETRTGYRIRVYDTTTDIGLPAVWATATDDDRRPDMPYWLCAAGAHFDVERAIEASLLELAPIIQDRVPRYRDDRERMLPALENPDLVRSMDDHGGLYSLPEAHERLAFLGAAGRVDVTAVAEESAFASFTEERDLGTLLRAMLDRCAERSLPLIAIDQTTPELRPAGLFGAKVLIPGALPMTFGTRFRRVRGLPRLDVALVQSGYDSVNPHPHPFP